MKPLLWLVAIAFAAGIGGEARAEAPALRLAVGAAYLRESWNPAGGSPGAVFSGGGESVELAVGKRVRPRLVVGGLWQLVAVSEPSESYLGMTSVVPGTERYRNVVAAFGDFYPLLGRGLRVGGSVGVVAATNVEGHCCVDTYWGGGVAVRVGYEVFVGRRWSVGAVVEVVGYRYSGNESNVSSASNGILPTLALAVTFDWVRGTR